MGTTNSPYQNLVYALKSKKTQNEYPRRLEYFFRFLGFTGTIEEKCQQLYEYIKKEDSDINDQIMNFVQFQKKRIDKGEITAATLRNYLKPLRLFTSMNDLLNVNWAKIGKGMPPEQRSAEDRIPTVEEIQRLLEHKDRRIKPIVLTMLSCGMRVGSWDHLKWKHVIPIQRDGQIIAAKIILKNTKINNKNYFSFITPEAYKALKEWIDFRQLHGEKITGDSWLMRDEWKKQGSNGRGSLGFAANPQQLNSLRIRNMLYDAWTIVGVRQKITEKNKQRKHEFKASHFARKFFETTTQKVMNHNNIKLLMDHSMGESSNYYRPLEEELFSDYLKAVDLLTIDEENKLRFENEKLKQENKDEIKELKRNMNDLANIVSQIMLTKQNNGSEDTKAKLLKDLVDKGIYISK